MELVTASDLFVTASLALLLSLLVAKLVSMAMASDPNTHNSHQQQPKTLVSLQQERLTFQKARSDRKVEFLGPIQVSTNVEAARSMEEETRVEIESRVVDFEVESFSNVAELIEQHVAAAAAAEEEEEEEEVSENNGEGEQLDPHEAVEDFMEQRKTEPVEDFEEQKKTESVKDSEEQRETEYCEQQREKECVQDYEEQRENCEEQREKECVHDCEEKRETEYCEEQKDCEEQRKTEGITVEPFDDDDDDWEGIERSELEKEFISASEFVVGGGGNGLGSDVQMELYGLHKVATEGPCHEPQPMALKLNARAKWNAWQKLGNMTPDAAMEKYISLLSDKAPGWIKDTSAGTIELEPKGSEVSEFAVPESSTYLSDPQMTIAERELEQKSGAQDHSTPTETKLENNGKK